MHASAACRLARKKSRAGSMNATFDSLTSLTHSSFTPFIPYPHSRHHRSTRTHVLLSLSPHTIRRRHAAASSCTSCVPHGRTTGPTSPGTALLCYSVVLCLFCASERPRSTTASSSSRVPAPSLRQVVLPVSQVKSLGVRVNQGAFQAYATFELLVRGGRWVLGVRWGVVRIRC